MKTAIEILKMGKSGVLDHGQVHHMLHKYSADRVSAGCVRWMNEEGGKHRMFANDLETKLKPVIRALSLIGNMSTYPARVANKPTEDKSDIVPVIVHNATEYYTWLIKQLQGDKNEK
jgi:hypothetical protein